MNLSGVAIRRGVTFGMIYVLAIGFGIFSLSRLKIDLYPDITFPVVLVMSRYTGASPYDIETVIARPLEGALSSVEGVTGVTSVSRKGITLVVLDFDWGYDMDLAQNDVRRALEWVEDAWPEDATNPLVFAFDPSQMPIVFMGVSSPVLDQAELRTLMDEQVVPRMERIEGVAAADIIGGLERQIRIEVDPRALSSYGLPISAVVGALQSGNLQVPGGIVRDGRTAFSIQTLGEFQSLQEIEDAIVTARAGQVVHVKDVARVVDGFKELDGIARVNGSPGMMLMIRKQSDANTVQVVERINEAIPTIQSAVPGQIQLAKIFDQADFIQKSIGNLSTSGITAFFLAALVLLVFLRNIRSMLIVATAIPTSIIVTFFVLDMYGTTLNIISMAGLALAVGMLVDNSIVVLENIYRFREMGEHRRESAEKGASQVGMAITASTLTTLAVFLPILFVPGISGVMFRDMVIAICFALTSSLFVAITLVPLLSSRLLTRPQPAKTALVRWVAGTVEYGFNAFQSAYSVVLRWSLKHRIPVVLMALGAFIGSFFLLDAVGVDFLPKTDQGDFQISVERAVGTDMPSTLATFQQIEHIIEETVPEARDIYSNIGSGGSLGSVFQGLDTNSGTIRVKLVPRQQRTRTQFEIQDALRVRLNQIPGITYTFAQSGGMQSDPDIEVKLFGHDLNVTGELGDRLVERFSQIEGAVDVASSLKRGAPELQISLDRARLQAMGLTAGAVTGAISNAVQGITATQYRESGDEYDVFVRLAEDHRNAPEDLEQLVLALPTGGIVPLRQVAEINREVGPVAIQREDQSREVVVEMNVSGRDMGSVEEEVQAILAETEIPQDVIVEIGGGAEDRQESFFYLTLAIFAGILLVYMVMASQFESLVSPFIILFTIPLSIIGVALGLWVSNTTLSLMAMIGMLVLVGIVVNNGIVLVDYMNQLREMEGKDVFEAAYEGGRTRMRPVLMTAFTTIFGMLPLAIGSGEAGETWAPLARSVMGGLTVATLLTLIMVPVIYTAFASVAERVKAFEDRRVAAKNPELAAEIAREREEARKERTPMP